MCIKMDNILWAHSINPDGFSKQFSRSLYCTYVIVRGLCTNILVSFYEPFVCIAKSFSLCNVEIKV